MAFTTLLGSEEAAAAFLADVQDMAAMTNYTYDEITGYAKSLVKPFGADKSPISRTTLSDARPPPSPSTRATTRCSSRA